MRYPAYFPAKRGETAAQAERMAGLPLRQAKERRVTAVVNRATLHLFFLSLKRKTGDVLFSRAVSSQVHSALRGLTSVFGMGTGGSLLLLSPVWLSVCCTLTTTQHSPQTSWFPGLYFTVLWSSPRPISIGKLNALLHLHIRPINLVVFKGSYYLTIWDILSWGGFHA